MGFFNDIGKKTSEATSKIAKETKLKMKINENKGKIKELYEEIGKKVYEKHVKEELAEECAKLDGLCKEIEEARKEILTLNQKKVCSKCYAEIEKEAQFCPKCGERQTEEKTVLEKAEEKLEEAEIKPEKEAEAKEVKEELEEKNNNE